MKYSGLNIAIVTSRPEALYIALLKQYDLTLSLFPNIEELISGAPESPPQLVLLDCDVVTDGVIATATRLREECKLPSIALINKEMVDASLKQLRPDEIPCGLIVINDCESATLVTSIMVSIAHFHRMEQELIQVADYKQALEDRKVIEKAKRILMTNAGLSEQDAFRRLQRLSATKNRKMIHIADMIVLADEYLQESITKPER